MKEIQIYKEVTDIEGIKIDTNNIPTAKDTLKYFHAHIYPAIKKKYESMLSPSKRGFLKLFGK